MKNMILTSLAALLSIAAISVQADIATGDPLGMDILGQYMRNHEAKYNGMTMQLSDDEVKQYKAGKHKASLKDRYYVLKHIIVIWGHSFDDIACAAMKLEGNQLTIKPQHGARLDAEPPGGHWHCIADGTKFLRSDDGSIIEVD